MNVKLRVGDIVRYRYDREWTYDVYLGNDRWLHDDGEIHASDQENVESALGRGFWYDGFDDAEIERVG